MYIFALFLSSLFLSHLFLFLSRSRSLSCSVSLFLSSLPLSLAVSLQVFVTLYLYVSRTRARSFSFSQTFSIFLSLSLFLSCSLALSFSFFCIHICNYQNWEDCTQPHLSGFTLGNSLERWCFFSRAELNVAEVLNTRFLPPVVPQVPHIFRPQRFWSWQPQSVVFSSLAPKPEPLFPQRPLPCRPLARLCWQRQREPWYR